MWGYDREFIGPSFFVALASRKVDSGTSACRAEIELAGLLKPELYEGISIARELAGKESMRGEHDAEKKWLYLVLLWVFENRHELDDPLGVVETVYADFGYPRELDGFIRYMPVEGDYDPLQHSKDENERRLIENWNRYLTEARNAFSANA